MQLESGNGMKDWFVFIRVVEMGSFSLAAQSMNISVSAVSKALVRLESFVKATLIVRSTRKIEVTEAGRFAYVKAKEIVETLQSLLDELRNPDAVIKGQISLAAPAIICEFLANRWAYDFVERHREAKVYLESREIFSHDAPEFDNLVLKTGRIESDELVHRQLAPLNLVLCASPEYLRRHEPITHPRDLDKHLLLRSHHHGATGPVTLYRGQDSWCVDEFDQAGFSSNNLLGVLNLAIEGKGISIGIPAWLVTGYVQREELEVILPEWKIPELPVYLVWRHRQFYSPLFRNFSSFIEQAWNGRPQLNG
ncbi:LysR family transcriptional regulator [Xanthomonas sontii]|uniref:LysR family transcriptional regulator n=1 Tax=Xanthomonas sontii TaxID=2650745 RepID=UPI003F827B9D